MTQLIARLMLAAMLLPLSVALLVMLTMLMSLNGNPKPIEVTLLWVGVDGFVVAYWLWVWKDLVHWTPSRRGWTVAAGGAAILVSTLFGAVVYLLGRPPLAASIMVGGGPSPIVWVFLTILIWRESATERRDRLRSTGSQVIPCPVCGYNLTGLRDARCPECGASFTLNELMANTHQPDPLAESEPAQL